MIAEKNKLYPGAVPELNPDPRAFDAENILAGSLEEPIDYTKVLSDGTLFDIRRLLSYIKRVGPATFKQEYLSSPWSIAKAQDVMNKETELIELKTENQNAGDNCVWQASSKYAEVLNFIETGQIIDLSSKYKFWAYALAFGAKLADSMKSWNKNGWALESQIPSYRTFKTSDGQEHLSMDNAFFRDKSGETLAVNEAAKTYLSKSYAVFNTKNIETIAKIIMLNFGAIGGYYAQGMSFRNSPNNIFALNSDPKGLGHSNYFGRVSLEKGKLTLWSKDSYGDWNGRDKTKGWLGMQEEIFLADMTFDWHTAIDASNLGLQDTLDKEKALKNLSFMNGRKTKDGNNAYMFQRVDASGEVYLLVRDEKKNVIGFKFMLGQKCTLFDWFSTNLYFVPINEALWEKIKVAEIGLSGVAYYMENR